MTKWMSFSLLKCYDRVIADLQFNNTSKLASRGPWFFESKKKRRKKKERKEKAASQRDRYKEREYFHWVTQRAFCQTSLSRSSEMVEKSECWGRGGRFSKRRALTRPPPSFCVYRGRRPPGFWRKGGRDKTEVRRQTCEHRHLYVGSFYSWISPKIQTVWRLYWPNWEVCSHL